MATNKKFIYYTGGSALIPVRFWTYTVMTETEFEAYRQKHCDCPIDLKKIPYTLEKWNKLTENKEI